LLQNKKPINTKAKVVPVYDVQAQRGRRDIVPFIQSLGTRWMSGELHAPATLALGKNPGTQGAWDP